MRPGPAGSLALGVAVLSIGGLAAAASVADVAGRIPARKPGWWEMRMTVEGPTPAPTRQQVTICTDPAIDQLQTPFGVHTGRQCPPLQVERTGSGWAFQESCQLGSMRVSTTGEATGDLQSHYHVDLVTQVTPPPTPAAARTQIAIDATWLGACPAGRKPGDVSMRMDTNVAPPESP